MGAYDASSKTTAWFEAALVAPNPKVRWRAVQLLEHVETPHRDAWLERMRADPDPRVVSVALTVAALAALQPASLDLMESDFAQGVRTGGSGDLDWEWEYRFVICEGLYVPMAGTLVWTRDEDDEMARRLALMKAGVARTRPDRVAIMAEKRFVNRYTRSPRTLAEAMRWSREGRPRPGTGG